MAISIGTSGVVSAISTVPTADVSGLVSGFADATGQFLPLACTLNASRVLDAAARMLGVDHAGLAELALQAPAGSGGLVLVPYLEGERTPNKPDATGSLHGLTLETTTPAHVARAAVEGMLCALADGLDALAALGVPVRRILLIGGGAQSAAVRRLAPTVLSLPVSVPAPGDTSPTAPPGRRPGCWRAGPTHRPGLPSRIETFDAAAVPAIRDRYAAVRDLS